MLPIGPLISRLRWLMPRLAALDCLVGAVALLACLLAPSISYPAPLAAPDAAPSLTLTSDFSLVPAPTADALDSDAAASVVVDLDPSAAAPQSPAPDLAFAPATAPASAPAPASASSDSGGWMADRRNQLLGFIHDVAIAAGLGEDGARAAQSVAVAEGGLVAMPDHRDIGDDGTSFGPFQFNVGGELVGFARQMGLDPLVAGEYARQHAEEAIEWALQPGGYLSDAIRRGLGQGLSGSDLAAYAEQYGQVSADPGQASSAYNQLFGDSDTSTFAATNTGNDQQSTSTLPPTVDPGDPPQTPDDPSIAPTDDPQPPTDPLQPSTQPGAPVDPTTGSITPPANPPSQTGTGQSSGAPSGSDGSGASRSVCTTSDCGSGPSNPPSTTATAVPSTTAGGPTSNPPTPTPTPTTDDGPLLSFSSAPTEVGDPDQPVVTSADTPELDSMVLMGTGLLGLGGYARFRWRGRH